MEFLNLIQSGDHKKILEYVQTCEHLASYEELALMQYGTHEEIITYLMMHSLEATTFLDLVSRGNLTEIRLQISLHRIYDNSEDVLLPFLEKIAHELTDRLLSEHKCTKPDVHIIEYCECLLLKSGNHSALKRYLSQIPTALQPKALKLFKMTGYATKDDKLIYEIMQKTLSSTNRHSV